MIFSNNSLPPLLRSLLSGNASHHDIKELIRHSHRMAVVRLRQLIQSGKLHLQSFPITVEAVAFDCIADMFARDDDGRFIDLEYYFSGEREIQNLSDAQAAAFFRIMLFRVLYDGVFRLYQENDPILAKILRSLKAAIKKAEFIRQDDRFGVPYLFTCEEKERNDHLPETTVEELTAAGMTINPGTSYVEFLHLFFDEVNRQEQWRRMVSLFDIAVMVKRIAAARKIPVDQIGSMDNVEMSIDIHSLVGESMKEVESRFRGTYVTKGKMSEEEFRNYMHAIEEIIADVFVSNNGDGKSLDRYFIEHSPGMTYEIYRSGHRTQFEYMVRTAKQEVKKGLMELL